MGGETQVSPCSAWLRGTNEEEHVVSQHSVNTGRVSSLLPFSAVIIDITASSTYKVSTIKVSEAILRSFDSSPSIKS